MKIDGSHRVPVAALTQWAARVLQTTGVSEEDAATAAKLLVRSDLRGFGTHGLARLTSYIERLQTGDFNPRPDIRIDRRGPNWNVDADGALGQVVGQRIITEASTSLATEPIVWVSLRESGHLGALGIFALAAAERGYICFLGQRTPPLLGLEGFRGPGIGHNPFAFGAPVSADRPPFVLDMACSVAARGHILLAAREGKPIPESWALSQDGKPTTNAAEAADGMLRPAGDYKGIGIAMIIECLAAALAASSESNRNPTTEMPKGGAMPRQSAFFLFFNPGLLEKQLDYFAYMQHWIDFYKHAGAERARIPGERGEEIERKALVEGLTYPAAIEKELRKLADKTAVPFLFTQEKK